MNEQTRALSSRLQFIIDRQQQNLLTQGLKGLEKESLRISAEGRISQKNHPHSLGSALTHPHITTDYSEALLEFITPPQEKIEDTLDFLHNIHQFAYQHLDNEMLLAVSMPCGLNGDESVRIAEYGTSNIGKMKHVYRRGLWHRYGRSMQAIAGIHFNYSVPEAIWPLLHEHEKPSLSLQDFISEAYFGLIRNFQRQSWLILYLFGASPAICKNFFKTRPHLMKAFDSYDEFTLFHPHATSLRMSDIGYKSTNQSDLKIDYNSLHGYVDSLSAAIDTPYPEYEDIGIKVNSEYQQLNANVLQIENEYYSTVRPKQIADTGEKPTLALKQRGVRYVEVRSLDLDPFNPIGIDETTGRFVEVFLLNCLLQPSPLKSQQDQKTNNANQLTVAHRGREQHVTLQHRGESVKLKDWANEIFMELQPLCELMDQGNPDTPYTQAWNTLFARIEKQELTTSAQILAHMTEHEQPFGQFGLTISTNHRHYFKRQALSASKKQYMDELVRMSHAKQAQIELADTLSFDQYLHAYFAQ